jgi:hypothetical protein
MSGKVMDIELFEKENAVVYKHLKEGKTFVEIAQELGYANASGAQKAFKRAVKRIEHPDREDYLKAHVERLDALIDTYALPAIQGNLKAFDALITAMRNQADLLGLKAPVKIEQEVNHNGLGSLDAEVIRIARVIEYIEGNTADITTIPELQSQSKPDHLESPSESGTVTA